MIICLLSYEKTPLKGGSNFLIFLAMGNSTFFKQNQTYYTFADVTFQLFIVIL